MQDPVLVHVIRWMRRPKEDRRTLSEFLTGKVQDHDRKVYGDRQQDFVLHRNLLYLKSTLPESNERILLFVVPSRKRQAALDACHRDSGHQGRDRTLSLLRERFWWPRCRMQAVMAIKQCGRCTLFEGKEKPPKMVPIMSTEPLDLLHIDFVTMEITVDPQQDPETRTVLVIVDHFTRYVQAHIVPNQTARTAAEVLYNKYFTVFGFPRRLMSDQAPQFEGKVIKGMCDFLGVEKIRTTPYHPQSNGSVERTHQTIMRMIGKLDPDKRANWPAHLGSTVHAYNATRSMITGFSPYFLMFGRRPRLPMDLIFPTARRDVITKDVDKYVAALYDRLRESVVQARANAEREAQRQTRLYNRKAGAVDLRPGDRVLVRLDAYKGLKRKLKNRWSSELHTVVRQVADGVPAYVIEKNGREQTIHRSRLLLWLAGEDEPALGIKSAEPEAAVTGAIPQQTPVSGAEGTLLVMCYGLEIASFRPVLGTAELRTGCNSPAMGTEPLLKGTGPQTNDNYGNATTDVGGTGQREDVPR